MSQNAQNQKWMNTNHAQPDTIRVAGWRSICKKLDVTANQNTINVKIDKKNAINEKSILELLEHSIKEAFEI